MTTKRTPGRNVPRPRPGALTTTTTTDRRAAARKATSEAIVAALVEEAMPSVFGSILHHYSKCLWGDLRLTTQVVWESYPEFDYHLVEFKGRGWETRPTRHVYVMNEPWRTWSGMKTVWEWLDGAGFDRDLLRVRAEQYALSAHAAAEMLEIPEPPPELAVVYPLPVSPAAMPALCVGLPIGTDRSVIVGDVPLTFLPGAFDFHRAQTWALL